MIEKILSDKDKDKIEIEIDSLSELPVGWHFGEGYPPTKSTIDYAKDVYRKCNRAGLKKRIFPSIEGGVTIVFYGNENRSLEMTIDEERKISASLEAGYGFEYDELDYLENTTVDEVKILCKKLMNQEEPNLSELSIQDYTIQVEDDSQAIVSKNLLATEGYPSLIDSVSWILMGQRFVNT